MKLKNVAFQNICHRNFYSGKPVMIRMWKRFCRVENVVLNLLSSVQVEKLDLTISSQAILHTVSRLALINISHDMRNQIYS